MPTRDIDSTPPPMVRSLAPAMAWSVRCRSIFWRPTFSPQISLSPGRASSSTWPLECLRWEFHDARRTCLNAGEMGGGLRQHAFHEELAGDELGVHARPRAIAVL